MSEVKNIPRLRFPEFEEQWSEWLFSDFYDFQTTNSFSRDKLNYEEGDIYNLHYGDIHTKFRSQFILKSELVPFINSDVDTTKLKENNYLKEGDLVIADASEDYGDIGKTIEIIDTNNQKVVAGLHTLHAKSKNKLHVGFGSFLMKCPSSRKSFKMIAQGTKVLGISSSRVNQISLTIPTLPEQQKIADFLTVVDKRIELLEKKKTLMETYKKGVMKMIFNQEIRFKDDNGNDFPDWEEKRLGELAIVKNGYSFKSSSYNEKGNFLILTISNVQEGKLVLEGCKKIIETPKDISQHQILEVGDLLISMTGNVGRVAIVDKTGCLLNQRVGKIIPQKISMSFLFQVLNSVKFRENMISISQGGAQPNLSKSDIENYLFSNPSLDEQKKISEFLSSIDNQIELLESQIDKSKTWKKGLLQKMFV